MSVTFTKLFSSITESTIWCESSETRICWITMLAMSDSRGRVFGSIPGLANRARITVEDCRTAIACFLAPDADSRTKDHDGRRVEEIDGGWRLVNHEKYRAIRDEESIKASKRKYINAKREAERLAREEAQQKQGGVDQDVDIVDRSRVNADADTEADKAKQDQDQTPPPRKRVVADFVMTLPTWIDSIRWQEWLEIRRRKRTPNTEGALKASVERLTKWRAEGFDPNEIVRDSVSNGWQGLFRPKGNDHGTTNTGNRKPSLSERVAANERRIFAAHGLDAAGRPVRGPTVDADGGDLRPPLDGTARRIS